MKNSFPVLAAVCVYFLASADLFGAFSYVNNNSPTTIVPYGGTYTYSVTWTGGTYGGSGVRVGSFQYDGGNPYLGGSSIAVNSTYGANDTYSYAISGVDSSNDGYYCTSLSWGAGGSNTTSVYLHISPAILTQPQNTICLNGASTTMGIAAGPSKATFQWFDSASGNVIWTGSSFSPTTANNGERVYCKVSNSYGSASSSSAVLTVGTPPTISSQPTNVAGVFGGSATFSVTATGTQPLYYQWYEKGVAVTGANVNSLTINPITSTNVGSYSVTITNQFGYTNSVSASLTVTTSPPTISAQPTNVGAIYGSTVTFNVTANGTQPLSYQWYKNGTAMQGANLNYIILPSVTNTDNGTYQVAITNLYGNTNSVSVKLTVANPVVVTSQPSSLIVTQGQTATFYVNATGDSLAYRWRLNNNTISGATNNFYAIPDTTFSANGGIYSVVITNPISSFTSSNASLTVVGLPIITVQPSNTIAGVGSNATFSVSATAGASPIFYQWFNTNNAIPNQTNSLLRLQNLQLTDSGGYYVILTNNFGSVTSSLASLTVQQYAPIITVQPIGGNVVVGSNFTFIVSASGTTLNYQWQNENGYIAGANAYSLTVSNVTAFIQTNYSVVITNPVGCITSSVAILNVGFPPVIIRQPVSITANYGGNSSLSCIVTGTIPVLLQWLGNGTAISGQTNTILILSNIQSAITGFQLTATNAFGGTISSNASINIKFSSFPSNLLQGLVSYYPFIGNANDFIGTNNGTVNGAVLTTDRFANSNSTYLFNSSSSYIDMGAPSDLAFTNDFSITVWCLFSDGTQNPRIISYGIPSGYELITDGTGASRAFDFICNGQNLSTPISYSQNVWYAIAVVVQNETAYIYVDGQFTISNSVSTPSYSTDFEVGMKSQQGSDYWGGSIDDVRLYNRALSSNEVSQLFNLESGNLPPQNLSANLIQNNAFQLEFFGTPNYSYILQAATNLTPPINWQSIITNTTDANGFWNFADTNTVLYPARFYRAMVP